MSFKTGDIIKAYGTRGVNLTYGKEYRCLYGTEKGIFPDRPFVSVINDLGQECAYHQSRFENLREIKFK